MINRIIDVFIQIIVKSAQTYVKESSIIHAYEPQWIEEFCNNINDNNLKKENQMTDWLAE